jgi:hypothetical protein
MHSTYASAYDQNPARMALVVRRNRNKHPKQDRSFAYSLLVTIAAGAALAFHYLLSKA